MSRRCGGAISEFIDGLNEISLGQNPVAQLQDYIWNLGLRFSWEMHEDNIRRIVVYPNRSADYSREINFLANGLVLAHESGEWRVLAIPPAAFIPRANFKVVQRNLHKYTIYEAYDGTTLTLYYYDGQWRLSSARSYEINNLRWHGTEDYWTIFTEIAARYPTWDIEKLNKGYCYVFGIRCHKSHPLLTDPERMWFIQCADLSNCTVSYENHTGIPSQKPLTGQLTFSQMMENNNKSVDNYLQHKVHNYGYILRGSYDELNSNFSVYLESTLMRRIRQFYYNIPRGVKSNRHIYMVANSYINYTYRKLFTDLFPQMKPDVEKVEKVVTDVKSRVLTVLKSRNPRIQANVYPKTRQDFVDVFANNILMHIQKNSMRIYPFEANATRIITDLICNRNYLDLFVKTIVAGDKQVRNTPSNDAKV